jgi:biotin operon repressor
MKTSQEVRAGKLARIVEMASAGLVTSGQLTEELRCHERTIYRYVSQLRAKGVDIRGEAGYGYRIFRKGQTVSEQKTLGVDIMNLIISRYPDIMAASPEDIAVISGSLASSLGGVLAAVYVKSGPEMMLSVLDQFSDRALESMEGIIQKTSLLLAQKPEGTKGEN